LSSVPLTGEWPEELLYCFHRNESIQHNFILKVVIVHNAINVSEFNNNESGQLWEYVQTLQPETIAQLSQPGSQDVIQMMERNIGGLLGGLPREAFDVTVSTTREQLGQLLANAMMNGYFLRNAEQRLALENTLGDFN
jgi:hypothetical protein